MTKAVEYRKKAQDYEAMALKGMSAPVRQLYEKMARDYPSSLKATKRSKPSANHTIRTLNTWPRAWSANPRASCSWHSLRRLSSAASRSEDFIAACDLADRMSGGRKSNQ